MIKRVDIVNHETTSPVATSAFGDTERVSGFALWEFQQGQWLLKQDESKPGFRASAPPTSPGSFDGQLRTVLSELQDAEPALA